MTEFKGTPGPWRAEEVELEDWSVCFDITCGPENDPRRIAAVENSTQCAAISDRRKLHAEDVANAHLIAAAPGMLYALQLISAHNPELCDGITASDCIDAMREIARIAVAKAIGEPA